MRNKKGLGWIEKSTGYRRIEIHGQRYYMHRLVMERKLKRKLEKNEEVHHINANRLDNRIENLELVYKGVHLSEHKRVYDIENGKKECSICHRILPLKEFYKRNTLLGYWSRCKSCQSVIRKAYYKRMKKL